MRKTSVALMQIVFLILLGEIHLFRRMTQKQLTLEIHCLHLQQ